MHSSFLVGVKSRNYYRVNNVLKILNIMGSIVDFFNNLEEFSYG
jgi:hypothetical protein